MTTFAGVGRSLRNSAAASWSLRVQDDWFCDWLLSSCLWGTSDKPGRVFFKRKHTRHITTTVPIASLQCCLSWVTPHPGFDVDAK